jgi:tetratricopeptide (TPR) repeat protein
MKKIVILSLSALIFAGCGNSASQPTGSTNAPAPQNTNNALTVSSHQNQPTPPQNTMPVPKSDTKSKWTQGGNPIDTTKFDADIAKAQKDLKAKPNDDAAKKALAAAYVVRGLALTDARQYSSALGDYRKAQKLDPTNADANKWVEQIVGIYDSMNKEYPKEGEEPPPLPFKKDAPPSNKPAVQ